VGLGSPELGCRGGELRRCVESREEASRETRWGQGGPGRNGWRSIGGAVARGRGSTAEKSGGGGAELRNVGRKKKGWVDLVVNMEKFRGYTVKQNFPLFYGSNEKVPKMKVVQFFEIYNFHVVQIFIIPRDFELF